MKCFEVNVLEHLLHFVSICLPYLPNRMPFQEVGRSFAIRLSHVRV